MRATSASSPSSGRTRAACSATSTARAADPGHPRRLSRVEEFGPVLGYVLRSLQDGGDLARSFMAQMVEDAVAYIADGVTAGTIRPSRDEEARAVYVVTQSLGTILLDLTLHPPADPTDTGAIVRGYLDRLGLPAVELFTDGFLTDRTILDAYLRYAEPPPGTLLPRHVPDPAGALRSLPRRASDAVGH
ncbi:hypothetical protein NKG05_17115 [Oerskovia sp. M15]